MKAIKPAVAVLMTALLVLSFAAVLPAATTNPEIEQELMCNCGCNDLLINCACENAEQLRGIIDSMLDKGKSKKEILAAFVSQFGESILSAPPTRGFNLIAYIVPFVALLAGVGVALVFVRKWTVAKRKDEPEPEDDDDHPEDEMEKKIDDELQKMDDDA